MKVDALLEFDLLLWTTKGNAFNVGSEKGLAEEKKQEEVNLHRSFQEVSTVLE